LPKLPFVAKSGVDHDDVHALVELHNRWRRNAPEPAAAMQKIHYDRKLAFVAQKHADRCSFSHDDSYLRSMPGWF
jgi:hypothetical protein